MFRAIGIGYASSLPSAAALSWVLKDGLGRLSRCVYTASLASAFDTNLKVLFVCSSITNQDFFRSMFDFFFIDDDIKRINVLFFTLIEES